MLVVVDKLGHFPIEANGQQAQQQATEQHLQILSELAQMFSDRGLREQLAAAPDAAAIHTLYANWDPHAAGERRAAV